MKQKILVILALPLVVMIYLSVDYFIAQTGDIELPPAPILKILDQGGKIYELEDFKHKLVVLNFWASWCPPCLKELPSLIELAGRYPEGVVVLAVLTSDQFAKARSIMGQLNPPANFIFMHDFQNSSKLFGTSKLPETYIIRNGYEIMEKISGDLTQSEKDLATIIERYLPVAKPGPAVLR